MGTGLPFSGPYGRLPGLPFSGPLCFRCLCHGHFWQFCRLPVHCQGCDGLGNVQDCRVNVQGCWSFAQVVPNTAAPQMALLASSRPVLQPFFGGLVCGDPVGAVGLWRSCCWPHHYMGPNPAAYRLPFQGQQQVEAILLDELRMAIFLFPKGHLLEDKTLPPLWG